MPGIPFDSYVLPESAGGLPREDGTAFVITGALHGPSLNHSLRLAFLHAGTPLELHQQTKCPKAELLDGWQPWWDLGWFKTFIGQKCKVPAAEVPALFNEYWDSHIQLPRPPHDIIFFSQGARFAASADRIRERPKEYYEALLKMVETEKDPCYNYFNEWIWYYIIGKPLGSPCNADMVVDEANAKSTREVTGTLMSELVKQQMTPIVVR